MKYLLSQEIAMAIQKGDVNYAATLQGMGLTRTSKGEPECATVLSQNEKLGQDFVIRQLRDGATNHLQ